MACCRSQIVVIIIDRVLSQVQLTDGRTLSGDFLAFDKQGALILGQASEQVVTSKGQESRHIGIVLIPSQFQERVELQVGGAFAFMQIERSHVLVCSPGDAGGEA